MLIEAIAIGLVYGFFLFEWSGLVAGGLIAPGYFAMYFSQPGVIAACLAAALGTMLAVRALSWVTVLYGRRRFLLSVLIGFALQWSASAALLGVDLAQGRLEVVGYVIPGLVANEMDRQGIGRTLLALLLVSCLVYLTMRGLQWYRA